MSRTTRPSPRTSAATSPSDGNRTARGSCCSTRPRGRGLRANSRRCARSSTGGRRPGTARASTERYRRARISTSRRRCPARSWRRGARRSGVGARTSGWRSGGRPEAAAWSRRVRTTVGQLPALNRCASHMAVTGPGTRDILVRTMLSSVMSRAWRVVALAFALLIATPSRPFAHEIPASVTLLAFAKPEAKRLRLVVRLPLESIRDVEFPTRGPGYLDIARATPLLPDAARLRVADYVELYEGDVRLPDGAIIATRLSLPSDRSFAAYQSALAHVTGPPLADTVALPWQQAMFDVLIEYAITSGTAKFSIRPALAHLGVRTTTVLRFLPPNGAERVFEYRGDPGLVRLDPRWHQAALRFVRLGFGHILDGIDHLLFVLCLVIPFRRVRPLVAIITSFTVAHSITLIASASGFAPSALWFPPLIEVLIALSIVYMAFENIVGARIERRWIIAFAFGLVHGFGFSFVLRESLQFAGTHLVSSLVAFNVGVELGQLFVLAVALPVLAVLFRYVVAERVGTILLSALVAHTAWHWMTERGAALKEYRFTWPAFDVALAVAAMRALMLMIVVGAAAWAMYALYRRLLGARRPDGVNAAPIEG